MSVKAEGNIIQVYGSAKYSFGGNTRIELFLVEETETFLKGYVVHADIADKEYWAEPGLVEISKTSVNGFKRRAKFPDYLVELKGVDYET